MLSIDVPGYRNLRLVHLVLDYNGTLAVDGKLLPRVAAVLTSLAATVRIHVITADTFERARTQLAELPVTLTIAPHDAQAEFKLEYVRELGADSVVAIGNGRNDREMLGAAALGIALIQREGAAAQALASADLISSGILDALELLRHPQRLIATLRS